MDLLQYRSNEMFSSTELIRKSKMVFDKISKKEIEKAVILRELLVSLYTYLHRNYLFVYLNLVLLL